MRSWDHAASAIHDDEFFLPPEYLDMSVSESWYLNQLFVSLGDVCADQVDPQELPVITPSPHVPSNQHIGFRDTEGLVWRYLFGGGVVSIRPVEREPS